MSKPTWKERLTRIWADVVSKDSSMAELSSASNLFSHDPFLVGNFPGSGGINRYSVRVSHNPVEAKTILTHYPFNDKAGKGILHQAEVSVLDSFEAYLPKTSPYRAVADAFSDPNVRVDKQMAVQLYHELLHAALLIEGDAGWPIDRRRILPTFNSWAAPAWGQGLATERASLLAVMSPRQFAILLNEKFVIQKAFAAFGVVASNEQIAEKYVRTFPELIQSNLKLALLGFFKKLDLANRSARVPTASPKPNAHGERVPVSPSALPGARQPRRFPIQAPRRGNLPVFQGDRVGGIPRERYRPQPFSPYRPPTSQTFKAYSPQTSLFHRQAALPPPRPRADAGFDRFGAIPSARGIIGGRIAPITQPALPTYQVEHLRLDGRQWDPDSYSFSDLEPHRWRPDMIVYRSKTEAGGWSGEGWWIDPKMP